MGLLFETTPENVLIHLKNIFAENELPEAATAKEFLAVQSEGKRQVERCILHYNLDAIVAVGYRVNSKRASVFQQWAMGVLRDYTLRGYVMDRKRMENGAFLDEDYFERLLEEIREIHLSERRFYQKIADIYSTISHLCSCRLNYRHPLSRKHFTVDRPNPLNSRLARGPNPLANF